MRRNEMFERNRRFRSDEGGNRRLRLTPRHSATIGHYSSPEPNEYSDDYYGPGDRYEGRGFDDDFNPPRQDERGDVEVLCCVPETFVPKRAQRIVVATAKCIVAIKVGARCSGTCRIASKNLHQIIVAEVRRGINDQMSS
ncbi:MAG TPA: hypothetical protein VNA21_07620, partial [Steroidobacteraceae bacterium]|nr:hypothetical protein [Steroidobacteraceae bacterium]